MRPSLLITAVYLALAAVPALAQNVVVQGEVVHTMAGEPIENGVVVITDGKIAAVGAAADVDVPDDYQVVSAAVVVPGLIDARGTVGLTGMLNQPGDQDQLDRSSSVQPELRAIDAYNPLDPLVDYVRDFGVTTVHTGHAPGALVSGQTCIVKTRGTTVDEALVKAQAMVAVTLGNGARRAGGSPGTRGKMVSMLRQELLGARDYAEKQAEEDEANRPPRDLKLETMSKVVRGEVPLLVHANRAQDLASVLRLAEEFGDVKFVFDSAAEAYLLIDQIKASGFPVLIHPAMQRSSAEAENQSFETAATLKEAGIPVALQSGYEAYVPKVRVLLFEAGVAATHGLGFDGALKAVTVDAANILGISDRVGTLEVGKDGDVALFDGDPFEYTTHCVGTVIEGELLSEGSH